MVWRFITRFLLNERVVDKLAESYPIRRAAQWVVYFINKTKAVEGDKLFNLKNQEAFKSLGQRLEASLKKVKKNLEEKAKKY